MFVKNNTGFEQQRGQAFILDSLLSRRKKYAELIEKNIRRNLLKGKKY